MGKEQQKEKQKIRRLRTLLWLDEVPPLVRRVIVGVIGSTLLLVGVAMIVLPGPAIVMLPLGLAVLATEFVWARRWLRKTRKLLQKAKDNVSDLSPRR